MLDLSFYWITRLDALNNLSICFIASGLIVGIVTFMLGMIVKYYSRYEYERKFAISLLRTATVSLIVFIVGLFGSIFIPTTKEYCAIKFVDYLESNDKARELPDKIIDKAYEYFDSELKGWRKG